MAKSPTGDFGIGGRPSGDKPTPRKTKAASRRVQPGESTKRARPLKAGGSRQPGSRGGSLGKPKSPPAS